MKLKFWEKDEPFQADPATNTDPLGSNPYDTNMGQPAQPAPPPQFSQPQSFSPQPDFANQGQKFHEPIQNNSGSSIEKDISLILAKLDAIKSELDSIHQRVQNLERQNTQKPQTAQRQYRW
jgi:hypothetical protein